MDSPDSGMVLRRGTAADLNAMFRLDQVCFDVRFRFSRAAMKQFLEEPGAVVVVAEYGESLSGFVILSRSLVDGEERAYVTTLDVAPEHRRRGVARRLLERAEVEAAASGAASIVLHVWTENGAAIRFYERARYQRVGSIAEFYGPGMNAWVYRKQL